MARDSINDCAIEAKRINRRVEHKFRKICNTWTIQDD